MESVTVYVHQSTDCYGDQHFVARCSDMSEYDWSGPLVCKLEVPFEVPTDFNPVASEVAALEKKKAKLLDEFKAAVQQINDRLNKLHAIEYTPCDTAEHR